MKKISMTDNLYEFRNYILEYLIEKGYKYIARDKDGTIYAYPHKPIKKEGVWIFDGTLGTDKYKDISLISALFTDIEWEDVEPFRIPYTNWKELTDNHVGQTRADITKIETVGAKNAHTEEVVASKKEIATNEKVDIVSNPAHYTMGTIEPKDFIRDQDLNFNRGNVIKYTVRAGRKDKSKEIEDIRKAKQYLEFEIEYLEGQLNGDIKSK